MASVLDPEVQLAQRLASNEKPLRTKALKKLRKYINVRSHIGTGGFTGDELLKLWKGLFYCLWMQDKPLLQEELSNQISTLIHSFQDIDGQMLYLETFLQTLNREWTGIDRLRMDKFFQLVRFMFRQTFELLKRKNWDSCDVSRFLELLRVQLLKESSGSPKELQFHILDLYMTELAVVGSEELTADQNLIFIEPFCKTAAKTKDRSLFTAICNSILSTIIEQAPFAIEDLMKEVKAAQDSDSGQSSEEDAEETKTSNLPSKKGKRKQINGNKSDEETGDSDHDDGAELLNLEDSDTVMGDNDIGPVLQFDYAALADKLFELASRTSTPSQNRQRLYKIIKVLRDLSEGIFPQSDYPEEVSTDEDDDMFGSRKRMKRGKGHMEEDEDGASGAKKRKGKKNEASNHHKQTESSGTNDDTPADPYATNEKKKKKKKKARQCESEVGEAVAQAQSTTEEIKGGLGCSHSKEETQKQSSSSPLKVAEAAIPEGQSETLLLTQITVIEEGQQTPCTTGNKNHAETFSNKQQQSETSEFKHGAKEALEEPQTLVGTDSEMLPEADATVSRKKRKRGTKAKLKTNRNTQVNAEAEIMPVSGETDDPTPTKKKKKGLKAKENLEEVEDKSLVNGVSTELDFSSICSEDNSPANRPEKPNHSTTISSRKRGKKNLKADKAQKPKADAQFEAEGAHTEALSFVEKASQNVTIVPPKKKTKKIDTLEDATLEAPPAVDEGTVNPLTQSEYSNTTVEDDRAVTENSQTVEKKAKNKKKLAAAQIGKKDQTQLQVIGTVNKEHLSDGAEVVSSPGKPSNKKRRKISVVFEYEADELEGATLNSGLPEEETLAKKSAKSTSGWGEVSTALRTKKSLKKEKTSEGLTSDFISFKSNHKLPTPLFCKTKGGPITLLYGQKKSQTPKSESKKVTFGLKNNKTAEFRKTDRSLLVSPDGSSRVPFDPKQKPQFGVLKTPPIPRPARKTNRKTSLETPKRRPK